ncbi:MAG: HEAT repeat domain-containing protein, partial [Candidatus Helarchaeota archaeon]|nr:HEAT repeat domain-containing protein [Candidatus Helarchaeota archaeon]
IVPEEEIQPKIAKSIYLYECPTCNMKYKYEQRDFIPCPKCKTILHLVEEEKKLRTEKESIIIESPPEKIQWHCEKCSRMITTEQDQKEFFACPDCGEQLSRVIRCKHCNKPLSLNQENYLRYLGKPLECPLCNRIFTIAEHKEVPRSPTEQEKYVVTYLEIDPMQFICPNCENTLLIENPDPSQLYECISCGHKLNRIQKCVKCGYLKMFAQENYQNFIRERIECPQCQKKQEEKELSHILANLRDENKEVRLQAAELLGEIGNKKAGPFLIEVVITDQDNNLRAMAITALGMIGVTSALPLLRRLMKEDANPEVRESAAKAVKLLEDINNEL